MRRLVAALIVIALVAGMTVPQEVRLARHAGDLDEDGHDTRFNVTLASGALSTPPTAAELVALLGTPTDGRAFMVTNTTTGFRYSAIAGAGTYAIIPLVLSVGVTTPDVFALTAAPNGGWTQIQAPKAVSYNGYTYMVWLNGTTGAEQVAAFHNASRVLSPSVTLHSSFGSNDNHASPAVLVASASHKLIVAYSAHTGPTLYVRRSLNSLDTDPTLSGGFAAELTPRTTGDYTYANLVQLDTGTVFLFYRYYSSSGGGISVLEWIKSTDEGVTWSGPTQIFSSASGHGSYWRIGSDGTKMHVIATDEDPPSSSTFHFYMLEDGTLHKSDGTVITAVIHTTDCTPVLAFGAGGANWSWGISTSVLGPATVLMQDIGSDNRIVTARYRSGSWVIDEVVASVGGHLGINQYASGAGIVPDDPNVVYYAKLDGSHWEQFRAVSADDGATWTETQLTTGSSVDNVWVDAVHDADVSGPQAVWLKGSYTNDSDYDFGISGALAP